MNKLLRPFVAGAGAILSLAISHTPAAASVVSAKSPCLVTNCAPDQCSGDPATECLQFQSRCPLQQFAGWSCTANDPTDCGGANDDYLVCYFGTP